MTTPWQNPTECIVLITGCSSGIGQYCAIKMHELGYKVIATARKSKDVRYLKDLGLEAFQLDLNQSTSIKLSVKQILAHTGGQIDVLFNNAGFGQPGAVEDLDRDVMRAQFETNVFGTMELTNLIVKTMRKQGYGKIIQNSSVLGFISLPFRGAYNASKHALEGFSDTMRLELENSQIQISLIEPGPVRSHFRQNAYQRFVENIDKDNSYWAQTYQAVQARLASNDGEKDAPFTLGPEAVLDKVIKIIKAKRTKPRYYVTVPTYMFGYLKRLLPTRWLDFCLRSVSKGELNIEGT